MSRIVLCTPSNFCFLWYFLEQIFVSLKISLLNNQEISKTNKTNLDPTTILISYKELFERCSISQFFECDYLFKFLVYAKAGPKQLICEHRLTIEAFKEFLLNLEKSYKLSRIEP